MMKAMSSARGAALGVVLLVGTTAGAQEAASDAQTKHHSTRSHHSDPSRHHHKSKDKTKDAPAAATAPATAVTPAPATESASPAPEPVPPPAEPPAQSSTGAPAQPQADLQKSHATDRPWVKGVSQADQNAAGELFREGNGLLKESLFVQAAAKYREALRHWDHPGIHYNLALALLNLDQPVEVYTHLQEAVKYGPPPLDTDKFEHATRYRALIEAQLSRVEVKCKQSGAAVTMDGKALFTGPGQYEGLVRAGQHTIVAARSGYLTVEKTPMLLPGEKTTLDLKMYTAEQLTRYKRRWSQALPIGLLVTGIVIAGGGGIMHWQANEQFKQYDTGVTTCSAGNALGGCNPMGALARKLTTGQALQATAFTAYGVGGALVVVGGVLTYLNRGRPYHINADQVSLAPVVGPGTAGLMATIRY
jgi:hypothetical protein